MKQNIKLNNEIFVIKKARCELHPISEVRSLDDCYSIPSETKYNVYNYWLQWYMDSCISYRYILKHFTINSFNCMMFTLLIDVYDTATDDFIGQLYITKTRQEFWSI